MLLYGWVYKHRTRQALIATTVFGFDASLYGLKSVMELWPCTLNGHRFDVKG